MCKEFREVRRLLAGLASAVWVASVMVCGAPAWGQSLTLDAALHGTTERGSYQSYNEGRLEELRKTGQLEDVLEYRQDPDVAPLIRAIGQLDILDGAGVRRVCTGVLIASDKVLTNAHCVDDPRSAHATSIFFTLGFLQQSTTRGQQKARVWPRPLEIGAPHALDYAILSLADDIKSFEPLALAARDPRAQERLAIIGHPDGLPLQMTRGGCRAGTIPVHSDGIRMNHTCDTFGGSSGSLVFAPDLRTVVGLHNSAGDGRVNHGILITELLRNSPLLQAAFRASRPATGDPCARVAAPAGFDCRVEEGLAVLVVPERAGAPPFGIAWEHWLEGEAGAVGSVFRECGVCPEMVVMPAGRYLMGSPLGEGEDDERTSDGKRLDVRIQRFAMSRYEVSVDEYRRFVSHTQRNHPGGCWWFTKDKKWERREGNDWRSPGFAQGGTHPVACVSWDDAQAYIGWLNGLDGAEQYRLPSESEHEYATRGISGDSRGRTSTRYFWGDDNDLTAGCDYANGNDERGRAENGFSWQGFGCDDGFAQTSPVGSFSANGFGLYDMSGNVWEWVEDCWSEDLSGTPSDGGSRPSEHCDEISGREARVLRGGSWYNGPGNLRSANRDGGWPSFRFSSGGFRLSRTLTR